MRKKKSPIKIPKLKANELPATRGMLKLVRDELKEDLKHLETKIDAKLDDLHAKIDANHVEVKADICSLRSEIHSVKSDISSVKSDISSVKSDISSVKSEINSVKSDINMMKSDIHLVKSEIHRFGVLLEEQNANNRIVLEGLQALWERQDRIEAKIS